MSKFNTTSTITPNSTNLAGGLAFNRTDTRQEIISVVLNSMLNGNSYYESEKSRIDNILNLMSKNDSEFLAKLMVYVRTVANLRSVSHLMGVKLAETVKGSDFLKSAFYQTYIRPDDMTEMLSLWNSRNPGKMLPNSMRRAMKQALEKSFNEYQLAKYKQESSAVKLKDIVKMAHPNPRLGKYKSDNVFKDLIEGKLEAIETVQTVNASSTGEARADNYIKMLKEKTLGYMGLLKNFKNILESARDKTFAVKIELNTLICELLVNKKACLNSRVLPFRFTQALKALDELTIDAILKKEIVTALEIGFKFSAENLEFVEKGQRVALLLDESGSMQGQPFDLGKTMVASMIAGLDVSKTVGYLWAQRCREIAIVSPFEFIRTTHADGGGTDVMAPLNQLIKTNTFVDLIMVFTDMQMYQVNGRTMTFQNKVNEYRKINPKVKVIFWNLEGYGGSTPAKLTDNILEISGFSDKMLEVIPKLLKDKDALIKEVEAITL